jgi:hypothetical protein
VADAVAGAVAAAVRQPASAQSEGDACIASGLGDRSCRALRDLTPRCRTTLTLAGRRGAERLLLPLKRVLLAHVLRAAARNSAGLHRLSVPDLMVTSHVRSSTAVIRSSRRGPPYSPSFCPAGSDLLDDLESPRDPAQHGEVVGVGGRIAVQDPDRPGVRERLVVRQHDSSGQIVAAGACLGREREPGADGRQLRRAAVDVAEGVLRREQVARLPFPVAALRRGARTPGRRTARSARRGGRSGSVRGSRRAALSSPAPLPQQAVGAVLLRSATVQKLPFWFAAPGSPAVSAAPAASQLPHDGWELRAGTAPRRR